MLLDIASCWSASQIFACFKVVQHGFCSHMVLWIRSSLALLPAPCHPTPQEGPPRVLAGSQPRSSLGWLQRRPKRQLRTQPWQALCQGHSMGMKTQLCRALPEDSAWSHTTHGLLSLPRESPALHPANTDSPKHLSSHTPHRLDMGHVHTHTHTHTEEMVFLCYPEQPWHCPQWGPARDGCTGAEPPGPREARQRAAVARW